MDWIREVLERHGTDGEIVLRRLTGRDGSRHYEVVVNGTFLFSTYNRASERTLASTALEPLLPRKLPLRALVAGLGVGYTLQALLEHPQVKSCLVIEKEPSIVAWARTHFAEYNRGVLRDPRVNVLVKDIADFLKVTEKRYDVICMDVDNGPDWPVWEGNRLLYEEEGLLSIRGVMSEEAVLTVWSASRSRRFEQLLERIFGIVSVRALEANESGMDTEYYIYRVMTGLHGMGEAASNGREPGTASVLEAKGQAAKG